MANRRVDLTNQRFGRLVALRANGKNVSGNYLWLCRCDCGAVKSIASGELRKGNSQSCGCLQRELARAARLSHGMKGTAEYRIWTNIKTRCGNPNAINYHLYGGRGIKVCDEWHDSFEAFYAYVGPRPSARHSIDRINPDGHYEPGNVRWATPHQQQNNKRTNRLVTHEGVTRTLAQWARLLNVDDGFIAERLERGWSVAAALTIPAGAAKVTPKITCGHPSRKHVAHGMCRPCYHAQWWLKNRHQRPPRRAKRAC